MIRKNNKSKIFKIFSLSLVIFPNLSIISDLLPKRNYFFKKSHLKNTSTLADDDYKTLKINELTTKYPWLKKYRDDKNFANRDFNAYLNSDLIKKALIDQYLWYAMYAWNMFQCYIIKTYQKRLKFCYTFIPDNNLPDNNLNDTPFHFLPYQRDIFFDTNFFKQCEKIDWSLFFDPKNLKFNIDYDVIGQDIASCFFDVEKNGGIYYIDEKDKNNKNNAVNLKIKEEIKKAKKETIDYCKEELQIFLDSLNGNSLSLNKKIEKLISFLCDIVTSNRKIIDDRAIAKDVGNRNLEKTVAINFYHKALAEWLQNPYNVIRYIPNEAKPLLTNNKFEDFFNYLYCERKKYVNGKTIDFKKVMDDFIPIAQTNHSIIALEKAVASYTLAVLNNKKIISFTLEDHFAKYGQAYMKWITIITTAVTIIYLATSIPQLVLTDKVSFITNISFVDNAGLGTHSDFFLDLMGIPFNDGSNISGFSKNVISAVRASYNINTGMLAYAREGLVIAGAIAGPDIINKLLQNSTNNRTNNIEQIIRERAGNDLEERMPNIDNQENLNNGEGGNDRVLAEQERKRKEEERKRKEEEERRRKEEEERKRKEAEKKLQNLRVAVGQLWRKLAKLITDQNDLTDEYRRLGSMWTNNVEQLNAAISKYEGFKEKLEKRIEKEKKRKEREEKERELQNLQVVVDRRWRELVELIGQQNNLTIEYYDLINLSPTNSDEKLNKTINKYKEFEKKLKKYIKEKKEEQLRNLLNDINNLWKANEKLIDDFGDQYLTSEYNQLVQMSNDTDQKLDAKIKNAKKFKQDLLSYLKAQREEKMETWRALFKKVDELLRELELLIDRKDQNLRNERDRLNSISISTYQKLNEAINGYEQLQIKLCERIEVERKIKAEKERKAKEEQLRNLRDTVKQRWKELVKLTNEQNDLTSEYRQLNSMQTNDVEQLDDSQLNVAISAYENFKEKLDKHIERKKRKNYKIYEITLNNFETHYYN